MILRFAEAGETSWLVFPGGVYGPSSLGHEYLYNCVEEEADLGEQKDVLCQSAIEVGRVRGQRCREVYVRYNRASYQPAQVVGFLLHRIPGLLKGINCVRVEEFGGGKYPAGSVDKEFTVEEFLDQ